MIIEVSSELQLRLSSLVVTARGRALTFEGDRLLDVTRLHRLVLVCDEDLSSGVASPSSLLNEVVQLGLCEGRGVTPRGAERVVTPTLFGVTLSSETVSHFG